jgi:O-antigen/teichoic acid export membrane protein
MSKELLKNTSIYIVVSFFAQALVFFLWALLVNWIPPEQIGVYVLIMFVVDIFSAICLLGLDSAVIRYYRVKENINSVFNNALVIFLVASLVCLMIFWSVAGLIGNIIPSISDILFENIVLLSALIFVNSFFNFILAHNTALKKASTYAKSQLFKTLIFVVFAITFVRFDLGIWGVFFALFLSLLPFIFIFIIRENKQISCNELSFSKTKEIITYGFPLMLYAIFGVLISYFGRLFLDKYTDLATLGVYSFFLMLTLQVSGLWSSFNRAWTPEIFSRFNDDKEKGIADIQYMVFFLSFIYLMGLALVIIIGELFVFKHIFNEIYLKNISLFYILLIGPLFTGIYTVTYPLYYYENKTKKILILSIVLSLISIIMSLLLIKNYNQQGAAISYLLISQLATIVYLFTFRKTMNIPMVIINWTIFLFVLMNMAVFVLLKTAMPFLLLLFMFLGAVVAFILGGLRKRIIFLNKAN